jgi:uncharacterized coiled-coil protein SlyX
MQMREQLERRLKELKAEFASGQKRLEELEAQTNSVRTVMLRISGAIQVLEEELGMSVATNGAAESEQQAALSMRQEGRDHVEQP